MAFDYINEAFKKLDILEEQMFDTSIDGINQLDAFVKDDANSDDVVRVIDPEADNDTDIQDSYVGKVIVNCNVCHSHIFENKDEINIDEDGTVNSEIQCPYCGEQEGFTIIGEIAPFSETDVEVEQESEEDVTVEESEPDVSSETTQLPESFKYSRASRRLMNEDFKEVSITTDDQHMEMTSDENGKVTVTTEPITKTEEDSTLFDTDAELSEQPTSEDEMIVPVSDETEEEILSDNGIETEEPESNEDTEESAEATEQSEDVDLEEVDEEGLDELGESYFKEVYENVDSFKTTNVSATPDKLIVEGIISFNTGSKKRTGFLFEAKYINSRGQLKFVGYNKHISESSDAFSLVGRVDNKKLFVESLKYNYKVSENVVRGLVRRK